MTNEQIYIEQIDRLMDLQNGYFSIFLGILALFVAFAVFMQFKLSDKQVKNIKDSSKGEIKRVEEKSEQGIKRNAEDFEREKELLKAELIIQNKKFQEEIVTLKNSIESLKKELSGPNKDSSSIKRIYTIDDLLSYGIVKEGDELYAKNNSNSVARLLKDGQVTYTRNNQDVVSSINSWLKFVYDWKTVSTYDYAIYKETGQTLDELRQNLYEQEIIDSESSDKEHFNINRMLQYEIVRPGEKLRAKNKESFIAELLEDGQVKYQAEEIFKISSINAWLKEVYEWPSVSTYDYAVQDSSGKTLSELREESYVQRRKNAREKSQSIQTINDLLEHNIIQAGDTLSAKNKKNFEAKLLENGKVMYQSDSKDIETSINAWLKEVYGWVSVSTYEYAVHKRSGKTLDELRKNS